MESDSIHWLLSLFTHEPFFACSDTIFSDSSTYFRSSARSFSVRKIRILRRSLSQRCRRT